MSHRAKNEDPAESRAVFVDENQCIGCMNCVYAAPATFRMNHDYGRARVFSQWLNTEDELDTAVQSCPVDCIHWVERSELPALEYVCQNVRPCSDWTVYTSHHPAACDAQTNARYGA